MNGARLPLASANRRCLVIRSPYPAGSVALRHDLSADWCYGRRSADQFSLPALSWHHSTMSFPAAHRGFTALFLLVVATSPASWAQQHVLEAAQESPDGEFPVSDVLRSLREVLNKYKTRSFPGLPTLNIPGDQVSITISLADVYLEGLNDFSWDYDLTAGTLMKPRIAIMLNFKKISLLAGSYTSSGHILNLPFNGEGPMYIHLHNLLVNFSFGHALCAKRNTTDYDLDLIRMEVHLENLNEGTDQGQLIDIVVPSFGQDIVERLEVLIKTKWYEDIDRILVELINSFIKQCNSITGEHILVTDKIMEVINDIVKDLLP